MGRGKPRKIKLLTYVYTLITTRREGRSVERFSLSILASGPLGTCKLKFEVPLYIALRLVFCWIVIRSSPLGRKFDTVWTRRSSISLVVLWREDEVPGQRGRQRRHLLLFVLSWVVVAGNIFGGDLARGYRHHL